MRDEHVERLYDHLHTDGTGRSGAGWNRIGVLSKSASPFSQSTHIVHTTALYALRHCLVGQDRKKKMNTHFFWFCNGTLNINIVVGASLSPSNLMPWRAYFGEVGRSARMTYGIADCQLEQVLFLFASSCVDSSFVVP